MKISEKTIFINITNWNIGLIFTILKSIQSCDKSIELNSLFEWKVLFHRKFNQVLSAFPRLILCWPFVVAPTVLRIDKTILSSTLFFKTIIFFSSVWRWYMYCMTGIWMMNARGNHDSKLIVHEAYKIYVIY